jgi:hypothetical protein
MNDTELTRAVAMNALLTGTAAVAEPRLWVYINMCLAVHLAALYASSMSVVLANMWSLNKLHLK